MEILGQLDVSILCCFLFFSYLFVYFDFGVILGFVYVNFCTNEKKIHAENLMTGYRVVFDRENLKLGWSHSNCEFFLLSSFHISPTLGRLHIGNGMP